MLWVGDLIAHPVLVIRWQRIAWKHDCDRIVSPVHVPVSRHKFSEIYCSNVRSQFSTACPTIIARLPRRARVPGGCVCTPRRPINRCHMWASKAREMGGNVLPCARPCNGNGNMSSEPQLGVDLVHERVWVGFRAGAGLEVCRKIYSPIRRRLWGTPARGDSWDSFVIKTLLRHVTGARTWSQNIHCLAQINSSPGWLASTVYIPGHCPGMSAVYLIKQWSIN